MNKGYLGKILLVVFFLPAVFLTVDYYFFSDLSLGDIGANLQSSLIALLCWTAAGWIVFARVLGRRFFLILTLLVILRILVNFFHFYHIFAPLEGINSSSLIMTADFAGDVKTIFNSALIFIEKCKGDGLYFALFGNYDRQINNPGVAILYGWLISVFGAYATVAIPWATIYSGFGSLLIGLIGLLLRIPRNLCRGAVLLTFLMPWFFVSFPMYRDNFIVFLLVLSAYTAILIGRGNIFLVCAALLLESILLFSLRMVYLILPLTFSIIVIFWDTRSKATLIKCGLILGIIVFVTAILFWGQLSPYLVAFGGRFGDSFTNEQTNARILLPFKALGRIFFYSAAAVFSLLQPMPWWQHVMPALFVYHIFSYLQTWYSLTALVALYYSYKRHWVKREEAMMLIFSLTIFLLALFGSQSLSIQYIQVALPFVLLVSMRYLFAYWKKCFMISTIIIGLAHLFLWCFY